MPLEPPQYICFETLITLWFASLTENYRPKPIEGIVRLNNQTEFGTKATGTHRGLNGHSFQVVTKAH